MGVAQSVRAPDCGSGGRGFDPPRPPRFPTDGNRSIGANRTQSGGPRRLVPLGRRRGQPLDPPGLKPPETDSQPTMSVHIQYVSICCNSIFPINVKVQETVGPDTRADTRDLERYDSAVNASPEPPNRESNPRRSSITGLDPERTRSQSGRFCKNHSRNRKRAAVSASHQAQHSQCARRSVGFA